MNIILTVLAISLLVFFHELGHFLCARLFKVKVETFSVGFGPKLFTWEWGDTIYAISAIPLGGYVKMKGEVPSEIDDGKVDDDSFYYKAWWQRALIAFAGPLFSLLLGFILIWFSLMIGRTYSDLSPIIASAEYPFLPGDRILSINGGEVRSYSDIFNKVNEIEENIFVVERQVSTAESLSIVHCQLSIEIESISDFYNTLTPMSSNIVGEVNLGLPAWKAGIKTGDRILKIDGVETHSWQDIRAGVMNSMEASVTLEILRGDQQLTLTLIPEVNPLSPEQTKIIGITQHLDLTFHERYNPIKAFKIGTVTTISFVYMNYYTLYMLVKNPSNFKNSVGGPVMVFYMTSQTSERGFSDLCLFVAALSILLMIMNLLPIPVLDGGQIIFCIVEGIRGKPIPLKTQAILQQIGFCLLIALMIFAFYNDISKFVFR